ncbi:cysteine proteinase [Metschnikowia bicuspidata var. bicuspidata NRRL YB-4993]|uniref:Ubiquitin carboxyl-terminal hydrolase n=1 Tax=Metschnikowia bicuspidata var. bicuspidata NRRL YB-4993 TaxID=869754 RepID=A0A1A0H9L2_9ASCO|nr:cysteine proteinase [Metschnikowia bicuspidata var. bicuspidata NRRL YB-4993]OBA20568.1 cysteine proteinase [Metschnikowia bicuspidata var. bicuspidata NRRL YB-4993]
MAPSSELYASSINEMNVGSPQPNNLSSYPPDNLHSIRPCSHLDTVFETKAKSTIKSTYQQAIAVVVANNRLLCTRSLYKTKKDGEDVSIDKVSEYKEKVLKCSSCDARNFHLVFICLQCPHVGCYYEHAKIHAKEQNHMFAIDSNNGLLFCFQCHDYTNHLELNRIRLSAVLSKEDARHSDIDSLEEFEGYVKPSLQAAMGIKGLVNLGSTCFMSCILQTMLHNPLVRFHFFHNDFHYFNCESQTHYSSGDDQIDEITACVTCLIDSAFKEIFTSSMSEGFGITNLLTTAWYKQRLLAGFLEQDAHEFWQFLLNEFHNDYERVSKLLDESSSECKCVMHSVFMGELESSVVCSTCGLVTKKVDPLVDLALEINDMNGNSTLYDCLDQFTRDELLDVKYRCRSCRNETQAHRNLRIKTIPPVLSFQLKRFKHNFANDTSSKIEEHVDVPLFLDLTKYTSEFIGPTEESTDATKVYELFAIVNHTGLVNTGHYITYIKNTTGQWLKFDDSIITAASHEELKATNAYLLFYIVHNI